MASNTIRSAATRTFSRGFSAVPQFQPEVTSVGSGITVSTVEDNYPLSRFSISVKAGSRYETPENAGVSHLLRHTFALKTQQFSAFGLKRRIQQCGGELKCFGDHETVCYSLTVPKNYLENAIEYVLAIATAPLHRHWEVSDNWKVVKYDLESLKPEEITWDLLHKAAFRNTGLGNPLFVQDYRFNKISPKSLIDFYNKTHTSERMAFIGRGVSHDHLMSIANQLQLKSGDGLAGSSVYSGGEVRKAGPGNYAYVAIAGPGVGLDSNDVASYAVAQKVLSNESGLKYGSHGGRFASAIQLAGYGGNISMFNKSYTDYGLLGMTITAEADKASEAVKTAVKALRSLKISEGELEYAKRNAKLAVLLGAQLKDCEHAHQLSLSQPFKADKILEAIDSVTVASVQSAVSASLKGKVSMAAYGAIHNVPYIDELL